MPNKTKVAQIGPMAVQLEVEFLDRLAEPVREKKAPSVSAIIRTALEHYDFTHMIVVRPAQVTISVRLPVEIRRNLKKIARAKHTSIGQLVRTAVEAYLPRLEAGITGQLEMPVVGAGRGETPLPPPGKPSSRSAKKNRRNEPAPSAKSVSGKSKVARRAVTKKRKG